MTATSSKIALRDIAKHLGEETIKKKLNREFIVAAYTIRTKETTRLNKALADYNKSK
tara:strand:- start:15917 stop:16087 length:171 start_codon:yes stop_codon:yes gene_type:complete